MWLWLSAGAWADRIELVSGAKVEGEITDRNGESVTIRAKVSGREYTRKYPVERIHAIETAAGREVLNPSDKGSGPSTGGSKMGKSKSGGSGSDGTATRPKAAGDSRTKAEIESLIDEQGGTAPDWWQSTQLNYPQSLDLSFAEPAPPPWNPQKNIGQYLWDVINPNPTKWREGIRFMHHVLVVNKDRPDVRLRVMNTLGGMYFRLLQDYPRAAYWWHKAGVHQGDRFWSGVHLAECYWRMGSKTMAMDLLNRIDPQFATMKLLADMGETQQAIRMAEANTHGEAADMAYLYAGEACRVAGQHAQALKYYQNVLAIPATGRAKNRIERSQTRARANIEAIRLYHLLDLSKVPDGRYRASSPGYAGDVRIEVVVQGGRIEDVKVIEHHEKQFYSAINDTTRKILAKQGLTGIDATSQATITSEAIINATAKALAAASKQ